MKVLGERCSLERDFAICGQVFVRLDISGQEEAFYAQ